VSDIKSVLVDTTFLSALHKKDDTWHKNAKEYYKYFLNEKISLNISVISLAEFFVVADPKDFPQYNIRLIALNYNHSVKASEIAKILFKEQKEKHPEVKRKIIPNDAKIISHMKVDEISHVISSDDHFIKLIEILNSLNNSSYKLIHLQNSLADELRYLFLPERLKGKDFL
jgi:predicted nucleic acid-binding protein